MPKYKLSTERNKTKNLVKSLSRVGFNESAVARAEGVTPQAINQRLNRKPVQDYLDKYFASKKLKKKIHKRMEDGLQATKVISCNVIAPDGEGMKDADSMKKDFIDVPDHHCRHKYLTTYMQTTGRIKPDGHGSGNQYIQINYGYRKQPQINVPD